MATKPTIILRVGHGWLLVLPLVIQGVWPTAWMDRRIAWLLRRLTVIVRV